MARGVAGRRDSKAPSEIYRLHLDPFSLFSVVCFLASFPSGFGCVFSMFWGRFEAYIFFIFVKSWSFPWKGSYLDFERPYNVLGGFSKFWASRKASNVRKNGFWK